MIITPKQPRDGSTVSRLRKLVPYMLRTMASRSRMRFTLA